MKDLTLRSLNVWVLAIHLLVAVRSDAVQFIPLGDLQGGIFRSKVEGISGNGSVVVGESHSDNGVEAFRWTESLGIVGLGDLPGGRFEGTAVAASFDGSVIVGSSDTTDGSRAFRWTETESIQPLDDSGGSVLLEAVGLSADGRTVIGSGDFGDYTPFRWTQDDGPMSLGLASECCWDAGRASAVSSDGSSVFGEMVLVPTSHPFRWEESNGVTVLDAIGPFGAEVSDASADGGIFVGIVPAARFSQSFNAAYRWTDGTGYEYLLEIANTPGVAGDEAYGISADGKRIVGSIGPVERVPEPRGSAAAIWEETDGWRSIQQTLIDSGIIVDGWRLNTAMSISDDGVIVVGNGINPDGNDEAWLVDLSSPTLLPGDYDANNVVDQGDLDLVLLNWGSSDFTIFDPPDGWIRNLPNGIIDQAELDAVLLDWGNTQPQPATPAGVPEPGTALLVLMTFVPVLFSCTRHRILSREATTCASQAT